jgi:dihydrofolate synthase/folylpolyglutamate synthase
MNEAIVSHDGPGHRWLASLGRRGMELGLQRIRALLARLGDPQRDLPIIAVAGTDGKGSTSAMIAALLRAGGLRTAHYTSPHLVETRERIDLPDGLASAAGLDDALVQVYAACGADLDPTPFEALTAAALVLIRQADSEVAVLEVGLGGRLDAVNATEPVVSVITQLGYDHMAILGDTLPQIAWEKAGIARESRPLVCAQPGLVKPALRRHGIQPRLLSLGRDLSVAEASWSASRAHGTVQGPLLEDPLEISLALPGRHQFDNAALAVMAYIAFAEWWLPMTGRALPQVEDVVAALASVDWPLRAEVLQASPLLLADAAHNPSGMKALAAMLGEHGRGWQVMLAVRKDRDAAELIRTLAPWTACFWLPRCAGETLRAADELAAVVDQVAPACLAAVGSAGRCLQQALREADRGPGVVVTGSQHALGEWLQSKILHSPRLERRLAGNGRRV